MSKEEHDEELRRKKGDEAKLQMALDESRRQSAAAAAASASPLPDPQVCKRFKVVYSSLWETHRRGVEYGASPAIWDE